MKQFKIVMMMIFISIISGILGYEIMGAAIYIERIYGDL